MERERRREFTGDVIRYTNNTAGIENTLKGLIGFMLLPQTESARSIIPLTDRSVKRLKYATKHVDIARKVVRVLYFFDSAFQAIEAKRQPGGILKWLIMGKWICTFIFAATEGVAVIAALELFNWHKAKWVKPVKHNGHKFYFIGICFSIAAAIVELVELKKEDEHRHREKRRLAPQRAGGAVSSGYSDYSSASESDSRRRPTSYASSTTLAGASSASSRAEPGRYNLAEMEKIEVGVDAGRIHGTTNELQPTANTVTAHLLADVCDLAIPASHAGWFKNDEALSFAYMLHSFFAGSVIWKRVNAKVLPIKRALTNKGGPNGTPPRGGVTPNYGGQPYNPPGGFPGAQPYPPPNGQDYNPAARQ